MAYLIAKEYKKFEDIIDNLKLAFEEIGYHIKQQVVNVL